MVSRVRVIAVVLAGTILATAATLTYLGRRSSEDSEVPVAVAVTASGRSEGQNAAATRPGSAARAGQARTGEAVGIAASEWVHRYQNSTDYFRFATEAASAAHEGDGRAALLLTKVLAACISLTRIYGREADPEAALNAHLAAMPHMEQWVREVQEQEFRRCRRFFEDDPFAGLPPRRDGYPISYWREIAQRSNDPLVKVQQAMSEVGRWLDSGNDESRQIIQSNLGAAIQSQDWEAMYNAGLLLADGRMSADPLRGIAWTILACESGYDCSAKNPSNVFSACAKSGRCPADADWPYYVQQSIGANGYSRAYALAQELKGLMASGDWAALERYWTLDAKR